MDRHEGVALNKIEDIIEHLLTKRGYGDPVLRHKFLNPNYEDDTYDPYLLNDMSKAVKRLQRAKKNHESVYIYGDYDIDGLSATSVLLDAFAAFGIQANAYIPDRFEEGYGLNIDALKKIKDKGGELVVTVDCGSTSVGVVEQGNNLGLELIITDHHTVGEELPSAVAVINPKRRDNTYPFIDLAGVGVAFKLVQAMQQKMEGLDVGQEKWLLDLVALGTVCDVVSLVDENRVFVKWGLEVWRQTRRPGLQALLEISGVDDPVDINASTMGFRVGPRLNASGRMKHAQTSLDVMIAGDDNSARRIAKALDAFNTERRAEQDRIFQEAKMMADNDDNPVLILANEGWSHGIVGIVAAKILEKYRKPTFVMEIMPEKRIAKGSARSFGDFKAVDAVRAFERRISGGGHSAAAGISIKLEDVNHFRETANEYYKSLQLKDQEAHLAVEHDIAFDDFGLVSTELTQAFKQLAPFGRLNEEPLILLRRAKITSQRLVGAKKNHLQLVLSDSEGNTTRGIAFNSSEIPYDSADFVVSLQDSSYRPGTVEIIVKKVHQTLA